MKDNSGNAVSGYLERRRTRLKAEQEAYEKMNGSQKFMSWVKTVINAILVITILNGLLVANMFVPTPSMESTVLAGENLFVNKFVFGPSTPQIIPLVNIPLPYYKLPAIRDPRQGDIIVFIFPGNRDQVKADDFQYYLKRCVAVSGDTLRIVDDSVYVNGVQYHLPGKAQHDPMLKHTPEMSESDKYYTFPRGYGFTRSNYGPLRIPKKGDALSLNEATISAWSVFIQREGHEVKRIDDKILIDGKVQSSYVVERDYVFGMGDNRWNSADSRYFGFIPKDDVVGTPMVVYWSMENRHLVRSYNPATGLDEMQEEEMSFFQRLLHIRWSRLFTFINK
ncbi:MAG: signal peptidase I [Candidatus Kapaibacterium sp.]